jgi:hypothetical protein
LSRTANEIRFGDETLATLQGVNTELLTAADFVQV